MLSISFCQEFLIKMSEDTLNNLSNNLGSFWRILHNMGDLPQKLNYISVKSTKENKKNNVLSK